MSSANPNDGMNSVSANGASVPSASVPGASVPVAGIPPASGSQTEPAALLPEPPHELTPEERAQQEQTRQAIIVASIVGIIMLIMLIGFIIFLAADPARTALIRDIVIVLYAIGSLVMTVVIGILMVVLIYRIQELIGFLRGELIPMINNVTTSVNTVAGTASFMSDNVAQPAIKLASFMASLQQMAKATTSKVRGGR